MQTVVKTQVASMLRIGFGSSRQQRYGILIAVLTSLNLFCTCTAELKFVQADGSLGDKFQHTPVLLNYGEETAAVTVLFRSKEKVKSAVIKSLAKSDAGLWKAGDVITGVTNKKLAPQNWVNYTLPFVFEEGVGIAEWEFEVELESGNREFVEGQFIVAGIVFKQDGNVVSGIGRRGVQLGTYEDIIADNIVKLDVEAVGIDGSEISDLTNIDIHVKDASGIDLKQVEDARINDDKKLEIRLSPYRVGTGKLSADIDFSKIEVDGEVFETVLNLEIDTSSQPPPVIIGESVAVSNDGILSVTAFNLLNPPAKYNAKTCELSVDDKKFSHDSARSKFVQPDQMLVFDVKDATGSASVSCDGRSAVVLNNGSKSSSFSVKPDPKTGKGDVSTTQNRTLAANQLKPPLQDKANKASLFTQLRVVSGDPSTYTAEEAQSVLDAVCYFAGGSDCTLVNITRGSAILDIQNFVKEGDEEASREKLESSVRTCAFQKRVGVSCDEIELNRSVVVQSNSSSTAGALKPRSGLPKWAIGLSGVFGAIALVALVICALWLMHRHREEQEESDFSSSGPLGVPDPDDALYRQAIVRDIYGRGDYSRGLPSAAEVEERRKNAELREAMLRPPSSSRASSRLQAPTDEVSSTFSV